MTSLSLPLAKSPLLLVPKKDGKKRLCIDYRKLKAVTAAYPYLIPRFDELIDRLGRAKYLTTLDLVKGYWQVLVTEDDRPKTAFVTNWGKYQFKTMPSWVPSVHSRK